VTCSKTGCALHEWCRVSFPLKMEAAGFFFPKRCYVFNIVHCPEDRVHNIESHESLRCSHVNTVYKLRCPWDVNMSALLGLSVGVNVSMS
jgi:hypothetical protein